MTKTELIQVIAERSQLSKKQSSDALAAFIDVVTDTLRNKDSISLIGFGNFSVADRAARTGRNPKTGVEIKIAQTTKAKFKFSKAFDDSLKNDKKENTKTNQIKDNKVEKTAADKAKDTKPSKTKKSK